MTEQKQIEEMTPLDILANDIYRHCPDLKDNYCGDTHCVACLANALYNAGYRKQSEGEWLTDRFGLERSICSVCGAVFEGDGGNYCRRCGARMKGDSNG